jgi:hypothetical protein
MLGRIAVLLATIVLAAAGALPAAAQERVALVIGNGGYLHATALPNPANDARVMANALREIGFDVSEGADLNRTEMERLMRDFLRKTSDAKVALLYYAGHGMQIDGRNYLVPIDARLENPSDLNFETVDLDRLLDSLNDTRRASIVVLDACRDNPLARSFATKLGAARSGAVGTGLAAYANPGTGTLIAFATAPGKVALDGQGANSPFTLGLIKHLRTPGLEVRQLLTRVRRDVAEATGNRQIPWDNSSLLGDVYLAGRSGEAANPSPPADPPKTAALPAPVFSPESKPGRFVLFQGGDLNGVLVGDASGNWVESNTQLGRSKFHFRTVSENGNELVLRDASRDLSLRLNFNERQIYWRQKSSGVWRPLYQINGAFRSEWKTARNITFHGHGVHGVISADASGNWVENNTQLDTVTLYWRTVSDSGSEILLYDQSRDMYARLNFPERRFYWRQGASGPWNVLYQLSGIFY